MATNGESARQWLAENHGKASLERILQIRAAIDQKITRLESDHEDYPGLLEALDVMDHYLTSPLPGAEHGNKAPSCETGLDFSPLIPQTPAASPALSPEEKERQFRALLEKSAI